MTQLRFGGMTFTMSSFPFAIQPLNGVTPVPGATLAELYIRAEPVDSQDWRADLAADKPVLFRGVRAGGGPKDIITLEMHAIKATIPAPRWDLSFRQPVPTPSSVPA